MTPEERELLTRSIKISEENNKILRGMRRSARLSSFFHLLYWLIIIAITVSSYYFIKPFIDPIIDSYNQMQKSAETVTSITAKLPSWLGGNK